MIALDTDVLVESLSGDAHFVARVAAIPPKELALPVVVVEEIVRGRLHGIRLAEAQNPPAAIVRAYELLARTVAALRRFAILQYTVPADSLYREWRRARVAVGTHDLRIAAICIAHSATLVTRNRGDFERVPGLQVEFWA